MGFLKNLFAKEKSYTKYGDVLKKTLTTKEQRLEAIEVLEKLPADQSVPELLKRFEIVIESGLQDTREKEYCLNAIVKHEALAQTYVSIWGVVLTKSSLARFRFIFFLFTFLLLAFGGAMGWMVYKFYPLMRAKKEENNSETPPPGS